MSALKFDIHQLITDQIVAAIENDAGHFQLPWHRSGADLLHPRNIASQMAYRGVNILTLWLTAESKGFSSGVWGTFNQWTKLGATIRKGEKAAHVIFYKEISSSEADDGEKIKKRLLARATPIFAAEQVDGYEIERIATDATSEFKSSEEIDAFISNTDARIYHGGNLAYYQPITDSIHLPHRETFFGSETSSAEESYYSTLFHELTHNAAIWIMPHGFRLRLCSLALAMRLFGIIRALPGMRGVDRLDGTAPATWLER